MQSKAERTSRAGVTWLVVDGSGHIRSQRYPIRSSDQAAMLLTHCSTMHLYSLQGRQRRSCFLQLLQHPVRSLPFAPHCILSRRRQALRPGCLRLLSAALRSLFGQLPATTNTQVQRGDSL